MRAFSAAFVFYPFPSLPPSLGVHLQDLSYRFRPTGVSFIKNFPNQARNLLKTDASLQESGYRDLVGGIEGDRFGASSFSRLVS
jgi:hypothetical protein